jgi:hypothetical protein
MNQNETTRRIINKLSQYIGLCTHSHLQTIVNLQTSVMVMLDRVTTQNNVY